MRCRKSMKLPISSWSGRQVRLSWAVVHLAMTILCKLPRISNSSRTACKVKEKGWACAQVEPAPFFLALTTEATKDGRRILRGCCYTATTRVNSGDSATSYWLPGAGLQHHNP